MKILEFLDRTNIALLVATTILIVLLIYNFVTFRKGRTGSSDGPLNLGLIELAQHVRNDLVNAERQRIKDQQDAAFELKGFDLEINFVIKKSEIIAGKAGYDFIAVEANSEVASEKVQKVTLHMEPIAPTTQEQGAIPMRIDAPERETQGGVPPDRKKKGGK